MDAKIQAKMKAKMNKIRFSKSDKVYYTIDMCILVFLTLLVLYPLYFVVIASISDPNLIFAGEYISGRKELRSQDTKGFLPIRRYGAVISTRLYIPSAARRSAWSLRYSQGGGYQDQTSHLKSFLCGCLSFPCFSAEDLFRFIS